MRKVSQDLQLLSELEGDQIDIAKIREQRQVVSKIQNALLKKDEQITKIKALLQKYQHYQQKYTSLKVELNEKNQILHRKDSECKLLHQQLQQLMEEHQQLQQKIKSSNHDKTALIKQRHSLQITNKEIESTFKEYQNECRKRQNTLLHDLQRAYLQIKDLNSNIDQLQLKMADNNTLESKLRDLQLQVRNTNLAIDEREAIRITPERGGNKVDTPESRQGLLSEISYLRQQLLIKQQQLSANRALNYELTIEYDRSINSICSLQSELSNYRKQNSEIKKILSLLREKQRCQQIELKYSYKGKSGLQTKYVTPDSDSSLNSDHYEQNSFKENNKNNLNAIQTHS